MQYFLYISKFLIKQGWILNSMFIIKTFFKIATFNFKEGIDWMRKIWGTTEIIFKLWHYSIVKGSYLMSFSMISLNFCVSWSVNSSSINNILINKKYINYISSIKIIFEMEKLIVKFSKIKNNRLLNRIQMVHFHNN